MKKTIIAVLAALVLAFGFFAGCLNGEENKFDIFYIDTVATYNVTANGGPGTASGTISFVFSTGVIGLKAADITISSMPGAADKGTLVMDSPTHWRLPITVTKGGAAAL